MLPEIVGLILFVWILLVILQSFVHNFIIETMKDKPIYMQWFIIRGMVAVFHGALFHLMTLSEYLPILAFQLAAHIIIFNPLLNKLRAITHPNGIYHFWYLGNDSGIFDKIFRGNKSSYKVAYFMAILIAVLTSVTIYQRYV